MAVKSKTTSSASKGKSSTAKSAPKAPKYVYTWGAGKADGDGSMKNLLGGKGANLAEMTRIGLPVPPGFTITTEVCTYFYGNKKTYPPSLQAQMEAGVRTWKRSWARSLAPRAACRCSSPCVPEPATPCRA
jgi:pyruvate,orthophosphate dikinase